jgi:AcrR family transcriptional regulator
MPRGRPREFDEDKALDRAMKVFWRKGYEGASLPDLTEAMGINRPSMYAAFGNKEALFKRVLDRYVAGPGAFFIEALAKPTAREVVATLLDGVVERQTKPGNPRGCLMVQGGLACGAEAESVRRELVRRRVATDQLLQERFERAIADGDLPNDADASALAQFVVTIVRGMAVQSASGAGRDELRKIADMAMRALPA